MIQLQENTVVADRFRLVRLIGKGGMGSVWEAIHLGLETPCALKFIEGEVANLAEAHARFEREAKVSAQLRSPNIVQIIDHGVWQGRPYIAMELLEGNDLAKMLVEGGGKLPPVTVNMVVQQVCRALTKAHGAGIVHRDLKPDNVFIVNDDDRKIVKILDFGVAKSTGQAIEGSNTKTGAMLGTPYYMSPEQAQGIKTVDARSDLWSVAVIVFQCLTGKLPFESEALGDLLVKIIVQPIPVPSSIGPVPPGFDRWWAKASAREPEHRFQTAKELAAELELALDAAGTYKPGPPSYPNMMAVTGAMVQSPMAPQPSPAAFATTEAEVRRSLPHPNAPVSNATFSGMDSPAGIPKKGPPIAILAALGALVVIGLAGGAYALSRSSTSATPTIPTSSAKTPVTVASADIPPPTPTPATSDSAATSAEPATSATVPKPAATHIAAATTTTTAATNAVPPPTAKPAPTGSAKKKWDPGF